MILDINVDVIINASNFNHYKKYFNDIKCGDKVNVTISQLNPGTDTKIKVKCDICGNEKHLSYKMYLKNYNKYQIYSCSRSCSQIKIKKTCLNKYNVDNPSKSNVIKDKIKNQNLEKYGVSHSFQSKEVKEKIKITNNEKYGCDYPMQNKEILEKSNKTNIIKYGFKRASKNSTIKSKISKSNKKRWQKKLLNNFNIISISGNCYELMCDCGNHTYFIEKTLLNNRKHFNTNTCTICNKINSNSGYQLNILNFIKTFYDDEILINNRKILDNEYEIDIFLPKLNIGIEFNGLYWHSNIFLEKEYHYNKYTKSKEKGIQLIQIWEDEWISNEKSIKNYILNRIYNIINFTDEYILVDNMTSYNLNNYELIEISEPNKFYVKNKIRYDFEIDNYDFIVYDAGTSLYKSKI